MGAAPRASASGVGRRAGALVLIVGLVLAAFAESLAAALALGRSDIMGDTAATPDEFAWLDVAYTAAKILGFAAAPWLVTRLRPAQAVVMATLGLGAASALAAMTAQLELLVVLRALQGLAGGAILVAGQALLFLTYPRQGQPLLQAIFAVGAVVAPATLAPALQGWLIDGLSWAWVFGAAFVASLAGGGLILIGDPETESPAPPRRFDLIGFGLLAAVAVAAAYALSQGSRWNWLDADGMRVAVTIALTGLAALLLQQRLAGRRALIQAEVFKTEPFPFTVLVSLVAGASLFGSAFAIPAFAVNLLRFTPLAAGQLLLPGASAFVAGLLIAALLIQRFRVPLLVNVPVGIGLVMAAFLMLSGSTLESGPAHMQPALFLRALGLGFLFLALTIMAFGALQAPQLAYGIAIFNIARQFGGLFGTAGLQTLIDRATIANEAVLSANLTSSAAAADRLSSVAGVLAAGGLESSAADAAARGLLGRAVAEQAMVIAFDTAFFALALLFVFGAPVLIAAKIALSAAARRGGSRTRATETAS